MRFYGTVFSVLLGVILFSQKSYAQLNIGARLGGQISRTDFDVAIDPDSLTQRIRPGGSVGLIVEYRISDLFHVRTELNYSLRGRQLNDDRYINVIRSYNSFLDVPLMVGISWGDNPTYFYVHGGPNISYWLGGFGNFTSDELTELNMTKHRYQVKFRPLTGDGSEEDSFVYTGEVNRLQFGFDIAFGARFDLYKNQQIATELRLTIVQSNLGETYGQSPFLLTFRDHYNAAYQNLNFSVIYFFDLQTAIRKKGKSTIKIK